MDIFADLQIHSRFSRAVSSKMTIPHIAAWAAYKGIDVVATGDWTHPMWLREIEASLEEQGNGLLRVKDPSSVVDIWNPQRIIPADRLPQFMLATEVSCIYSQNGKQRRIHILIWVSSFVSARAIVQELSRRGCNLLSDGRPILGLSAIDIAEVVFSIDPSALVIPAHAWTPWFSVFGGMSGFSSLAEAFGPYSDRIYAIETGLSSNPSMNWQIGELDSRTIVSFSDAHSGTKLGREATIFCFPNNVCSFDNFREAIQNVARDTAKSHIFHTIEFYPEEGKYHFSGHRACKIRFTPEETQEKGSACPVCGKELTQGVVQRINELTTRQEQDLGLVSDVRAIKDGYVASRVVTSTVLPYRPTFQMLVPLAEILGEVFGVSPTSKKVTMEYIRLITALRSEFAILLHTQSDKIAAISGNAVANAIERVRKGDVHIDPGYDGVFGVVSLHDSEEALLGEPSPQLTLFSTVRT